MFGNLVASAKGGRNYWIAFVGKSEQRVVANNSNPSDTMNVPIRHLSYLVQPQLHGKRQRIPSLYALWVKIFAFVVEPNLKKEKQLLRYNSLRILCLLFSNVLKPLPLWTSYPNSKYSTLKKLIDRFNELFKSGKNIPTLLCIANGIHKVGIVNINIPIFIVGESHEHCIIIGDLHVHGRVKEDVHLKDLTISKSKQYGVFGLGGASIHLDNIVIKHSRYCGIYVFGSKRNTMKNCAISHSDRCGLALMKGAMITIENSVTGNVFVGKGTTVKKR